MKRVRCVDCHFLCRSPEGALTPRHSSRKVDRLALKFRAQDLLQHEHEFSCAKNLAFFHLPDQPELTIFDLTLGERQCRGYAAFDPSLTLDQMMQREAHKMPIWQKIAIALSITLGILAIVLPILLR